MAYTVSEVITHAEAGDPIKISSASPNSAVQIEIGGRTVTLDEAFVTKELDGNKNIDPVAVTTTNISVLDLGTLFTANDVLQSASLKKAVQDGTVLAEAGTVDLSDVPTV